MTAWSVAQPLIDSPPALSFTDITELAGVAGPTQRGRTGGHGVMWADLDNDRRPDLYITMIFDDPMPDLFFRNVDGARFADEAKPRGIDDHDGGSHGTCLADLDNDGDYDLYNGTTWDRPDLPAYNNLYRNDGSGRFTDVTADAGLPVDRRWPTRAVLTLDLDNDGDLDLFAVTNYQGSDDPPGEQNEAYRNDGNLRFSPINDPVLLNAPCGQGATDADYDNDGDLDIFAANRSGDVNILRNHRDAGFERIDPRSVGITHRAADGITLDDVDQDGDLDLLLAERDIAHLYHNVGGGRFQFVQSFTRTAGYMGAFADLDHDGDLDLVFAGDTRCRINDGRGRFADGPAIPLKGLDDPRGIALADIDADGDLDFAVACKRSRNALVRNDLSPAGNWLSVRLISPQGQAGAFGAKVRAFVPAADGQPPRLIAFREARSNNGYLGQNDPVLHLGLGSHARVDLVVTFLDGSTLTRNDVSASQLITLDARPRPAP